MIEFLICFIMAVFLLCIYLIVRRSTVHTSSSSCCIYVYYEKNKQYKENLIYFLRYGILPDVDYYFVVNGTSTVEIPSQSNIKVYKRENRGYDFGAFSYMAHRLPMEYDYYFFLNTSVRGPLLHDRKKPWTSLFIDLLDHDTKLAGTTINMYGPRPCVTHVQSMFFVMDNELFHYLRDDANFFNEEEINGMEFLAVIHQKEMGMTQLALKNKWNINSILKEYQGHDYRVVDVDLNPTSNYGDPYYPNAFFGKDVDPYDAIFFKIARFPNVVLKEQ